MHSSLFGSVTCRDEVVKRFAESITHLFLLMPCHYLCVWLCVFPLQKVCFCWRLINRRACWCLESLHPQGKLDSSEANCNIPAGLGGYVNHWLDISGRGRTCQRACYIEMSCVMLQNSLSGWWTITYRALVSSIGWQAAVHNLSDQIQLIHLGNTVMHNMFHIDFGWTDNRI